MRGRCCEQPKLSGQPGFCSSRARSILIIQRLSAGRPDRFFVYLSSLLSNRNSPSFAGSQRKIDLYAAMPKAEITLGDADLRRRCAFIIGSEGRGVSSRLQSAALNLRIPTAQVESLNASVAAGILLYEAWRQRTAEL